VNCDKDRYYKIFRNGKMENALCVQASWGTSKFEFLDGDKETIIITQDLIDSGLYKIIDDQVLNAMMA